MYSLPYIVRIRYDRSNSPLKQIIELPQAIRVSIQNTYICTQANRHSSRIGSNDPSTNNGDFCRLNPWHSAEQYTLSAIRLLKKMSSQLYRHPACYFTHWSQQWKTAILQLNRLISDSNYPLFSKRARQFRFRRQMQVRK
ncbi:hypothetical protein D3C81_1746940 [compost metagenome]